MPIGARGHIPQEIRDLPERVQSLEERQESADERFELILKELLEMKQMLHLLLENAGIPIPQKEKA